MKKSDLTFIVLLIFGFGFTQENRFTNNPDEAKFHTEDITRFWVVFDKTNPKFKGKTWQEDYLEKGSIGLKGFIPYRIESGKKLAKTLKKDIAYYTNIRENSLAIASKKEEFRSSFKKLKILYPKAVFPDVYFVIGRRNTGGTIFGKGLIIGAERFGITTKDFTPDIPMKHLNNLVAHELIHFQQNYLKSPSLLAQCIREGAGDFLGELISDSHTNNEAHRYGEQNIADLWREFLKKKDGSNWNNWLYGSKDKSRPKDLGYWIGYRICKSYYENSTDKKQAIHDMLNVKDFNLFLEKSKFTGQPNSSNN